jgi:alpha-glucosidase
VVTGHNAYPLSWQALSSAALDGHDATYFARSGWTGSPGLAPIHWPGDQRTSFDADDGLPSVLPLTLGGSIAGVPFSGSDVAGYQSIGNDPSTKELWMRWAALGAFSPIFRTHHGAFSDEDWQFDTDEATLAAFAEYSNVHARLFPYLRGLAEEAVTQGTPMVRPLFLHFASEAWSRTDAWLLGPSLLVAPVVEEGATARTVDLPAEVAWFDYWTGAPASSGSFDAPLGDIPVFAPAGAVIPEFSTAPDSLVAGPLEGITTLADADTARTVRVFGGKKGSFVEADGTTYTSDGEATGSGTATDTFASGTLTAAGLTLTISGEVERDYTLVVGG